MSEDKTAADELLESNSAEAVVEGVASEVDDLADAVDAVEQTADEEPEALIVDDIDEFDVEDSTAEEEPEAAPAKAEKEDAAPSKARHGREDAVAAPKGSAGLSTPLWLALTCAALVLGLLLGRFVLGGGSAAVGSLGGKTAVAESELDTVIATYTYGGSTESITIREVITSVGTLESAIDAEGKYTVPSADSVLSEARTRIIETEAANRGITVSDEDLVAYAEEMLGTSDYAAIGASYGMDEQAVIDILRSSALMSALRKEIAGESDVVMPDAPTYPETTTETVINEETGEEEEVEVDNYDTPTKEYADYIIALAGDEWDSATGTWVSEDGPYATALAGYEISADGATYDAATSAYYVAYQLYSESESAVTAKWTEFVNGVLSNASISISSLVA